MNDRCIEIADRLQTIVEDLDEIAFDRLTKAAAEGLGRRPNEDAVLTRVRRAVEKAEVLLRKLAETD